MKYEIEFNEDGFGGNEWYEYTGNANEGIFLVEDPDGNRDVMMVYTYSDGMFFDSEILRGNMFDPSIYNAIDKLEGWTFYSRLIKAV